jgi:hypothetical protein
MSSTKVKDRKGKHLDFYETPIRAIEGLFSRGFIDETVKSVLEPCAGRGAIVTQVRKKYPIVTITAVEIQESFSEDLGKTGADYIIGDFLDSAQIPMYDRIIANPPFSQAEEFIRHAFGWLKENGQMAFLLRLPFLAGVKRYKFFQYLKPNEINVLSQRPKFGGTNIDSCDYAWVIWHKNPPINITLFDWIEPSTPHSCIDQPCGA